MTNGRIDGAQIEAILLSGQPAVNRYLVESMQVVIGAVEETPEAIAKAVHEHHKACRRQSRALFYGLLGALATCLALATPYILRLF